jgi:hypothetical protein
LGVRKMDTLNKNSETINNIDLVLKKLLRQIENISDTDGSIPYAKLVDLFLKGSEIKSKLMYAEKYSATEPTFKNIDGIDENGV